MHKSPHELYEWTEDRTTDTKEDSKMVIVESKSWVCVDIHYKIL